MIKLSNFILIGFATLVAVGFVEGNTIGFEGKKEVDPRLQHTFKVLNKLDTFAAQTWLQSSGLTVDEVRNAYMEFSKFNSKDLEAYELQIPTFRILEDLLFVPLKRYMRLMGNEESTIRNEYIVRLEHAYRKFKPGYLGQPIGSGVYWRTPATENLIESLAGLSGARNLTSRMIKIAAKQYTAYQERLAQISELDDIYSKLDELQSTLNFLNDKQVEILVDEIYPHLNEIDQPGKLEEMKAIFKRELAARMGLQVTNGKYAHISG